MFSFKKKVEASKSHIMNEETKAVNHSSSSSLSHLDTLDSKNPFLNPAVAKHYFELYQSTKYECIERFDPEFQWTKEEEKAVLWKLEWRVTFLACFMFAALQIDRDNMGQAVADNLLGDLGMNTSQYNKGNTIFYLTFLAAELPSQLISKKLGSDVWIPIQMVSWSVVTICQAKMHNSTGFYITRALIGLLEGGFIADLVLWVSYFYTSSELSIRLSLFWTSLSLTQIITSIMAYGILHMRGIAGYPGWAWLFIIEGALAFLIGISAAFLMVPSVVQTKKPWNKKGWFTERQEKIVVNKILRDDPTKGDMHNRQGLTLKMLYQAIADYYLWPIYFIGITHFIPATTLSTYFSLNLRSLGFDTFQVNLLVIPNHVLHIIFLLLITWFSERIRERFLVGLLQPIWIIPLMFVLRFWSGAMVNKWGTYAVVTLILSSPYIQVMMVSLCSRNSQSIKTRTVSASLYNMFVQAGAIIASNIYNENDKPLYLTGNAVLLGFAIALFPTLLATKFFYVYINNKREKIWSAMTEEEKDDYILNSTDVASKRLDFRFAH